MTLLLQVLSLLGCRLRLPVAQPLTAAAAAAAFNDDVDLFQVKLEKNQQSFMVLPQKAILVGMQPPPNNESLDHREQSFRMPAMRVPSKGDMDAWKTEGDGPLQVGVLVRPYVGHGLTSADGTEYCKDYDYGRISGFVRDESIYHVYITWERTGLTSAVDRGALDNVVQVVGPSPFIAVGDWFQALPNQSYTTDDGILVYKGGEFGQVVKNRADQGTSANLTIWWTHTDRETTVSRFDWPKIFKYANISKSGQPRDSLQGRLDDSEAGIQIGALMQAKDVPITGACGNYCTEDFFRAGDLGRISGLMGGQPYTRILITWELTGRTTVVPREHWMQFFSLVQEAPTLRVGDWMQALPNETEVHDGVTVFKPLDVGRIVQVQGESSAPRVTIQWLGSLLNSTADGKWPRRFRLSGATEYHDQIASQIGGRQGAKEASTEPPNAPSQGAGAPDGVGKANSSGSEEVAPSSSEEQVHITEIVPIKPEATVDAADMIPARATEIPWDGVPLNNSVQEVMHEDEPGAVSKADDPNETSTKVESTTEVTNETRSVVANDIRSDAFRETLANDSSETGGAVHDTTEASNETRSVVSNEIRTDAVRETLANNSSETGGLVQHTIEASNETRSVVATEIRTDAFRETLANDSSETGGLVQNTTEVAGEKPPAVVSDGTIIFPSQ